LFLTKTVRFPPWQPFIITIDAGSHSKEKIEPAKQVWKDKSFPIMDNDDSYVVLPE
jgi:hypothetical protein